MPCRSCDIQEPSGEHNGANQYYENARSNREFLCARNEAIVELLRKVEHRGFTIERLELRMRGGGRLLAHNSERKFSKIQFTLLLCRICRECSLGDFAGIIAVMEFQLDQAKEILGRTPITLNSLLRDVPETWLHSNEGPETWSPFDVVGHLIHAEETD